MFEWISNRGSHGPMYRLLLAPGGSSLYTPLASEQTYRASQYDNASDAVAAAAGTSGGSVLIILPLLLSDINPGFPKVLDFTDCIESAAPAAASGMKLLSLHESPLGRPAVLVEQSSEIIRQVVFHTANAPKEEGLSPPFFSTGYFFDTVEVDINLQDELFAPPVY